jgi:hypothetical protein
MDTEADTVSKAGLRGPVGTLIRPAAMLDLAGRPGCPDGQISLIEYPAWQFYWLVP